MVLQMVTDKKYKYPPEEQENALDTVIKQCEIYADSDEN